MKIRKFTEFLNEELLGKETKSAKRYLVILNGVSEAYTIYAKDKDSMAEYVFNRNHEIYPELKFPKNIGFSALCKSDRFDIQLILEEMKPGTNEYEVIFHK
jgi:hypothetical protein